MDYRSLLKVSLPSSWLVFLRLACICCLLELCSARPQYFNDVGYRLGGGSSAWPNYLSSQLLASRGIDYNSLRYTQPQISEQFNDQLALSTQLGNPGSPVNFANNFGASYGIRYGDLINRGGTFGSSTALGNGRASGVNTANLYNNGYGGGGTQTYGYGTAQVPSTGTALDRGLGYTTGQSYTSGGGGQSPYTYNYNGAGNYGNALIYG